MTKKLKGDADLFAPSFPRRRESSASTSSQKGCKSKNAALSHRTCTLLDSRLRGNDDLFSVSQSFFQKTQSFFSRTPAHFFSSTREYVFLCPCGVFSCPRTFSDLCGEQGRVGAGHAPPCRNMTQRRRWFTHEGDACVAPTPDSAPASAAIFPRPPSPP
jgi:hypothetical protein